MRLSNGRASSTLALRTRGGTVAAVLAAMVAGVGGPLWPTPLAEAGVAAEAGAKAPGDPAGGGERGALTAFAHVDRSIGDVPHAVQLDVEVLDGTGHPPFTYVWDFGDATEFSKEKAPKHVYRMPGSFRASVIVTDTDGETDRGYFDISVNEPDAPSAITAEQLMEMMPPGEIAPELEGITPEAAGNR